MPYPTGPVTPAEVHRLIIQTEWGAHRSEELMGRAMAGSVNFGVRGEAGELVAYARVVTDGCLFAYLCDVVVDEAHRGHGYALRLMEAIMAYPSMTEVRRVCLVTKEAHGIYARHGFAPVAHPGRWMERFLDV